MISTSELPVKYRNIKGYVEYKFVTIGLPWYDIRRLTKTGCRTIWVFKADPLNVLDADSPEHYYAFTDYEVTSKLTTFGKLHKYIEEYNAYEEQKFLDAVNKR